MAKNIGTTDQGLRYCIAIACAITAYTRETHDLWFWGLVAVAGVLFLSALSGYSLLYSWLGADTLETSEHGKKVDRGA